MVLNLETLPRKAAVAIAAAAASMGLSLPLWSHYRVARDSAAGTRESLEHAISLQPANAELHNRLGRLLLYSPLGDAQRSRAELQRAVELDPRNGLFWIHLATARELDRDIEGAAAAIERGRAAEPRTPALLWYAANFEIRRGHTEASLALLRDLMQNAPVYTARVLPLFSRVTDPKTLVGEVVPLNRPAMAAALEFLRRENHRDSAAVAWERILKMEDAPIEQVRPFIDWLLTRGEATLAQRVWVDAAARGWIPIPAERAAEPLYNADFREPLEDFGFDWRVLPHPDVSVWLEGRGPEAGMNSLCVQFSENARTAYQHIQHFIPVRPNHHYSLQGAMRSDRLAPRWGVYLQVREVGGGAIARTEPLTGTGGWREVATTLLTGPDTNLVQLQLVRPAAGPAEEPASGMVCVAALRWADLGPAVP